MKLKHKITQSEISGSNWGTAKDLFPRITVDQKKGLVTIDELSVNDKKNIGKTHELIVDLSKDKQSMFVRGFTGLKNWKHPKCGGRQSFCFAIFVGDSGHIYTHRAMASKGWMNADPESIKKRLRKLGIGADENVIQQGDFLLKPANGKAWPDEEFKHERMGSGHHNFEVPVLYHRSQYWIQEPTLLIHTAVDGIQHPDVTVPTGKWIVGTTASQLEHSNKRD